MPAPPYSIYWLAAFLCVVFVGMLALFEVGRSLGKRHWGAQGSLQGVSIIDTAVFALLGLLIGFTFSGANDRLDARRRLIVDEANIIGTAYHRVALLPESVQPGVRADFRRYLESRLAFYRSLDDLPVAARHLAESSALQESIWEAAVSGATSSPTTLPGILMLPALNAMIDITTTRTAVLTFHPPKIVFYMLGLAALISAFLAGFEMGGTARISRLHVVGFAAVLVFTIYVIAEIEFPRRGVVHIEATDYFLVRLRSFMK